MIRTALLGASGFTPGTTPPSAAPTDPVLVVFGGTGDLFGISWTNGDSTAETEIGYYEDPTGVTEPTTYIDKVAPGLTTWNSTNFSYACYYWIRHRKGGSVSAWVQVQPQFDDCVGDPPEF